MTDRTRRTDVTEAVDGAAETGPGSETSSETGPAVHVPRWTREATRQLVAIPLGLLGALVPGDTILRLVGAWDMYALTYLALTWLAFRRRSSDEVAAMVRIGKRSFGIISSPQQLSQSAASIALLAAAYTMPRAGSTDIPFELAFSLSILAVVLSWVVLQLGFAMVYMTLHSRIGGFEFPGDQKPGLVDFTYFALAVGTTFGTTDVSVTKRPVRRQVLAHGALAFLFNTLVLALTVAIVTQFVPS